LEGEERADARAIVAHRRVPDDLLEARGGRPQRQAVTVPAIDLVLQNQFETFEVAELRLARVRHPIGQRVLGQCASPALLSPRLAAEPLSSNLHVLGHQRRST